MARARKSPSRSPRKSPKKSPKPRGRPAGYKMSPKKRLAYAKKRSMQACNTKCGVKFIECQDKCEDAVKMQYSDNKSQKAKRSAKRAKALQNPWLRFVSENQSSKPGNKTQAEWLQILGARYQKLKAAGKL